MGSIQVSRSNKGTFNFVRTDTAMVMCVELVSGHMTKVHTS